MQIVRFNFVEAVLVQFGYVSRKMLMDTLSISEANATRTLRDYSDRYPNNVIYCKSEKHYKKGCDFKASYLSVPAPDYLSAVKIIFGKELKEVEVEKMVLCPVKVKALKAV